MCRGGRQRSEGARSSGSGSWPFTPHTPKSSLEWAVLVALNPVPQRRSAVRGCEPACLLLCLAQAYDECAVAQST